MQQTSQALLAILSTDIAIRQKGQFFLQSQLNNPNFVQPLLQIMQNGSNQNLKQLASTILKRMVQKLVTSTDFKNKLVLIFSKILSVTNTLVSRNIQQIIYLIASVTNSTQQILKSIGPGLSSSNPRIIIQAVWAIHSLLTAKSDHSIEPFEMQSLGPRTLNPLLPILQKICKSSGQIQSQMAHAILKCFFTATFIKLPQAFQGPAIFPWMVCIKHILDRAYIQGIQFDKALKWGFKIITRFMQKHTNLKKSLFEQQWKNKYGLPFVQSCVAIIFQVRQNNLLNPITLNKLMRLLLHSFKIPTCSSKLIQYYDKLFLGILYSMTSLKAQDLQKLKEDTLQFTRRQDDQSISCPRSTLALIFQRMMKYPSLAVSLTKHLGQKINQNILDQQALYLLYKSGQSIQKIQQCALIMKQIFQIVFIQIIQSQNVLAISRVFQVITTCPGFLLISEQCAMTLVSMIWKALHSQNALLKIRAAQALGTVLKRPGVTQKLQGFAIQIIKTIQALINQFEVEGLLQSLQQIIGAFSKQAPLFAVDLITSLIKMYRRYRTVQKQKCYEQDQEQQQASGNCLSAIRLVLQSNLQEKQIVYITDIIIGDLLSILSDSKQSYLFQALNILNIILFNLSYVPTQLSFLLDLLVRASVHIPLPSQSTFTYPNLIDPPQDLLQNSIGLIRNFIAKKGINLKATDQQLLFSAVDNLISKQAYNDAVMLQTSFITLMQSKPSQINSLIPLIIDRSLKSLCQNQNKQLRSISIQLISISLYLNYEVSLAHLQTKGLAKNFFLSLIDGGVISEFSWQYHRVALGLIRMMKYIRTITPIMQTQTGSLLLHLAKLIIQIKNQQKQEEQGNEDQAEADNISQQSDEELDDDWEQQLNKLHNSPLDNLDPIILFREQMSILAEQDKQVYFWFEQSVRGAGIWQQLLRACQSS